ncbi:polysaccharide biosynthesis protein [Lysinibacillus sp. 3P01SB]|uniref:polysaccharide biosynthesis protein n=1 Tax=Lysinibacillus sp. 3P01SB TaxID=3132284 RepID=UPI0039A66E99
MNSTIRYSIFFMLDSLIVLSVIFISYWLLDPAHLIHSNSVILVGSLTLLISHHIMAYFFHLYNRIWSVASIRELLAIGYAVTISVLIASIIQFFMKEDIHFRVMVITWVLDILLIGGSRFLLRVIHDRSLFQAQGNLKRVLVIGAGEAGTILLRSIKRDPLTEYQVVAIVDDDPHKQKMKLMDIKVCGMTKDIGRIVQEKRIDEIFLAIPSLGKIGIRQMYERCLSTKIPIKIMPKMEDIIIGKVSVNDMQEVKIEDLLGREEVKLDMIALFNKLTDKVVLVTGAGGSIGSEICRQVSRFKPSRVVLVGHGENSIYNIHAELSEGKEYREVEFIPIIADVQDRKRIFEVVHEFMPDVIYHAAAHKHVPLMEINPAEAVKNNIVGTQNIAEAAHAYGVANFVMISTDKAVNPPNIMGATKRIAEMIIQNLSRYSETNFTAVRFGNVLGSRGSVVPRFQAQIAAGGPVTVTHPEMTRYFMTIPEASRLVLQAGTLARGGEVFVLDMGEPIKIVELAKNLIRLSGFTEEEIHIEFSGIRPGEKMYEELLNAEEIQEEYIHPKIHVGKAHCPEESVLIEFLAQLEFLPIDLMKQRVIELANGDWMNSQELTPKTIA